MNYIVIQHIYCASLSYTYITHTLCNVNYDLHSLCIQTSSVAVEAIIALTHPNHINGVFTVLQRKLVSHLAQ